MKLDMIQRIASKIRVFALMGAILSGSLAARAQLYEVTLSGAIRSVRGDKWDSTVSIGTKLTQTYVFDASAPVFLNYSYGSFYKAEPYSVTADFGDYHLTAKTGYLVISLADPNFGTGYQLDGFDIVDSPFPFFGQISGRLWSNDPRLLANTDQPVQELPYAKFDNAAGVSVTGMMTSSDTVDTLQYVYAPITSYSVAAVGAVPEASTYGIFGGVLVVGLAFIRLRRRK